MTISKITKTRNYVLTFGGLIGLIAMTWQAAERVTMLKNPASPLDCNLSPIIDCGTVLNNRLAALFGFPNAFIGMIVFSMLCLAGIAGLAGVVYTQKFRNIILGLSTILILFSMWFFGASLYSIGKICIFCAVGWIVSVPIFIYSFTDWLSYRKTPRSKKLQTLLTGNLLGILVVWYLLLICLFLFRFRDYYFG